MNRRLATLAIAVLIPLSGCATGDAEPAATTPTTTTSTASGRPGGTPMSTTRVRFRTSGTAVVVSLIDSPTSRDLVSKLPLSLTFEDFAGKEKISYLPARLNTDGSPGSAPTNGTLIYYKPWGNLGFYYNASGGHDDDLITLGTVESGMDQLDRLDQGTVAVEVVQP